MQNFLGILEFLANLLKNSRIPKAKFLRNSRIPKAKIPPHPKNLEFLKSRIPKKFIKEF